MVTMTATTAAVAKYLERDDVQPFVAVLTTLWHETGMDTSVLAHHLHLLLQDVNRDNGQYDLSRVDWEALAERYAEQYA